MYIYKLLIPYLSSRGEGDAVVAAKIDQHDVQFVRFIHVLPHEGATPRSVVLDHTERSVCMKVWS